MQTSLTTRNGSSMSTSSPSSSSSSSLQQVLLDNFREEGAAQRVVARTGGFALAGALSGATIAAWRFAPAIPAAFHSSISTASTAFVFFSLREYLAVPTFEHLRSSAHTATSPSPSLHLKNMVESASSGAATGAGFAIYHYGLSRRIVSGGFTFGLFAVLGQLGFNELNLARIRYVERNERASSQATTRLESEPRKPALYQRVTESFFSVAPIRRVSNEEYSETIKDKISKTQNELAVVNGQVHDIEERLQELRAVREQHERQV